MTMDVEVTELDQQQLVAEASACVQAEIAAGCRLLEVAAAWADAHPADGITHEHTLLAEAGERTAQFGGAGTPAVAEFAPAELGVEIGMNPYQAAALIADALDLRHRLPRIWKRIQAGDLPAWQARRVATRTRILTIDQAHLVDSRVADSLGHLSGKRLDNLLGAEILRVDWERVEADTERAARTRSVWCEQSTDHALKNLHAQLDAPDAIWFDGSVDQLADILMADPDQLPAGVPDRNPQSKEEWRAVAMAVLARPFLAAQVWARHHQPDLFTDAAVLDQLGPQPDLRPSKDPDSTASSEQNPSASKDLAWPPIRMTAPFGRLRAENDGAQAAICCGS